MKSCVRGSEGVFHFMSHPERVFRAVQNSWHPREWNENGAWLRMFQNARKWVWIPDPIGIRVHHQ